MDLRSDHIRYRKRSPENSRAGAQAYEATLRQKLARGETIEKDTCATDREMTLERFAQRWVDEYVVPNNKYLEQRAKKYILSGSLLPFFGKMLVRRISAYDIERYKAHLVRTGISNKTVKNRLTVLSRLLATAYEWLTLGGASPKIKWPKCASCRTEYFSAEECELLLSRVEGVLREMMLVTLRTGMRPGELTGLQWSSIDWQNRILTVRHSRCDRRKEFGTTKNNRERHIPMDIDVYETLFKRMRSTGYVFLDARGMSFNTKAINLLLEGACKEAGLRRITWHVLRHTFASHLAMRGVPLPVVQQLLGHSSITTTMRYAHVAPSTLRMAIDLLNPKSLADADFGQPVGNPWLQTQRREMIANYASRKNA